MPALALALLAVSIPAVQPTSATFNQLTPSTKPSARRSGGLAEEALTSSARLWTYGGYALTGDRSDTWYYDTATLNWVQRSPSTNPGTRDQHALAWDPLHARLVLFGGYKQSGFNFTPNGETWAYDPAANTWTQLTNQGTPPSARAGAVFVWSMQLQKFVLFGGSGSTGTSVKYNDLFTLEIDPATSSATWTPITATGAIPTPRNAMCAGIDPKLNVLFLFGGELASGAATGGTYALDLGTFTWTLRTPGGTAPSSRSFASCAFDDELHVLVLYGGYDSSNILGGLFFFDPAADAWSSIAPATTPGVLSDGSAAYSTMAKATLIFGGQASTGSYNNNLWSLKLTGPVDLPPSADAGPDQTIDEGAAAMLDGTASSDPESKPLTWAWTQLSGPPVTLSSATAAQPTFTAPAVTAPTALTFSLVVDDGVNPSAADTVAITVQDTINEPPSVDAGPVQNVAPGELVTLTATANDPNGELVTFQWNQLAGPSVTLSAPASATTQFTAPAATTAQTLEFEVVATDERTGMDTDSVSVIVAADAAPVADAGPDQLVAEQSQVELDASGSSDPESEPLSYEWVQLSGPAVTLSSSTAARPIFTAPSVFVDTALVFELSASDGLSATTDQVTITVQDAIDDPPVADAGPDQIVAPGAQVTLDGTASSDPNGEALAFQWTVLSGGAISLTGADTATPAFTAPETGAPITVQLLVEDPRGEQSTDEVTITVVASAPEIVSTAATAAEVGVPYAYDADHRIEAVGQAPLEYGLVAGAPAEATVDPDTGEVRWTPQQSGEVTLTFTARTRGAEAFAAQTVVVTVRDRSSSPPLERRVLSVGCGCATGEGTSGLAFIAAVVALGAARKRRTAPEPRRRSPRLV